MCRGVVCRGVRLGAIRGLLVVGLLLTAVMLVVCGGGVLLLSRSGASGDPSQTLTGYGVPMSLPESFGPLTVSGLPMPLSERVPMRDLAYSPDGKHLFAAGTLGLGVWSDGATEARMLVSGPLFRNVEFSPGGRYAAATGDSLAVLDLTTLEQVLDPATLLPTSVEYGACSAFSSDDRLLAVTCREAASDSWRIVVIDLTTGEVRQTLKTGDGGPIPWVGFLAGDRRLVSYTDQTVVDGDELPGNFVVWDIESGQGVNGALNFLAGFFEAGVLSPDRTQVLLATTISTVTWEPLVQDAPVETLMGLNQVAAYTSTPDVILSRSMFEGLATWRLGDGGSKPLTGELGKLAYGVTRDGSLLAADVPWISSASSPTIRVVELPSGEVRHEFSGHSAPSLLVAVRPDGREAASLDLYNHLRRWSIPAKP